MCRSFRRSKPPLTSCSGTSLKGTRCAASRIAGGCGPVKAQTSPYRASSASRNRCWPMRFLPSPGLWPPEIPPSLLTRASHHGPVPHKVEFEKRYQLGSPQFSNRILFRLRNEDWFERSDGKVPIRELNCTRVICRICFYVKFLGDGRIERLVAAGTPVGRIFVLRFFMSVFSQCGQRYLAFVCCITSILSTHPAPRT